MKRILQEHRRAMAEALHAGLAAAALAVSFLLRFEFELEAPYQRMLTEALPLALAAKLVVFRLFGLQHLAWRYVGFADLLRIAWANATASAASAIVIRLALGAAFPRSVYAIDFAVALTFLVGARAGMKLLLDRQSGSPARPARRTLIYGAGKAGLTLLTEIRASSGVPFAVAGFLDDDPAKRRMQIHGVRVLGGRRDLAAVVRKHGIEQVLIALPGASGEQLTAILEACHNAGVEARRIPAFAELIENKILVEQVREVRLEDLLGRAPVHLEEGRLRAHLAGKVVMVTGAGGSIGAELCRQIARFAPKALVGLDQAETPLYHIEQELGARFPALRFHPEIGSIQSRRRMEEVFRRRRPHLVFHAAAYKHVPMMEAHLFEAVENNVFGTANAARCAEAFGAEQFVLVSSDKAVRPTNVMGATKRLGEMVCLASNGSATRFVAVRFGNVLGSNGSVIPRFQQQIAAGGPLTVTHPEMRRYFMTIPEAAQLVLQAATMGTGGEIFVLDMGPPVRIVDLARKMILLSGLRPDRDIRIVYSGIRPGEKLFEEINGSEEDTAPTPHEQIRVFVGPPVPAWEVRQALRELRHSTSARDAAGLLMSLKEAVADYNPSSAVLRRALLERPKARATSVSESRNYALPNPR
jgi:FlaA1/EpsC-like NDP-sugar epimerase